MPEITQQQLIDVATDAATFSAVVNGTSQYVKTRLGAQIESLSSVISRVGLPYIARSKSVFDFGAVGDGVADDTAAFQAAIDAYQAVIVPTGIFKITASLNMHSGTSIQGYGPSSQILIPTGTSIVVFVATSCDNIALRNLYVNAIDQASIVFQVVTGKHVSMYGIYAKGAGLIYTNSATGEGCTTDPANPAFDCSQNVIVDHCMCESTGNIACNIFYTVDWSISNSIFQNCAHGVEWWGGDSKLLPGGNGSLDVERKCKRGTISNCIAKNVGAGFWGSMGQTIVVTGCIASHCGDVALDSEGGFDVLFIGNYAEHATFFLFGGFWYSQNTTFQNNYGYQDGTYGQTFFDTRNYTQTTTPEYAMIGNTLRWGGATGVGTCSVNPGTALLIYKGNIHRNVVVNFQNLNQGRLELTDNTFYIFQLPVNNTVINAGQSNFSWTKILRNTIESNGGVGTVGIGVYQNYYNGQILSLIADNFVTGPAQSIVVTGASGNGGIGMIYFIMRNLTDTVQVSNYSGGGGTTVTQNSNMTTGQVAY